MQEHSAVAPPATGMGRHLRRYVGRSSPLPQFTIGCRAACPLLELDGPHPVAYPLVQIAPDSGSIRQPEVSLPAQHINTQLFDHLVQAAPTGSAGQFPNALLERCHRLRGYPAFDLAARRHPKAVAQELAPEYAGYRALGLIDLET